MFDTMEQVLSHSTLAVDNHHGIYTPKFFAESYGKYVVPEISPEDMAILDDPENPDYWEVWQEIEFRKVRDESGREFNIYTNEGDIWLVPDGLVGKEAEMCLQVFMDSDYCQGFLSGRTGYALAIYNPERFERIQKYAESGSDGSTHAEHLEDLQEAIDCWFSDSPGEWEDEMFRDAVSSAIEDSAKYHEKVGTLDQIIG